MPTDVTLVLVHGAWADGSSWARVIDAAEAAGVRAVTAPLPLSSFEDDVAALDHTLEHVGGPVVLAAHAYAGGVIAATTAENVRALVYVAALAPAEGETVAEIFGRGTAHPQSPELAPDAHGLIWLPDEVFAGAFAHRATAAEQTRLRAVQRPISITCITTPVGRPRWQDLPTWYLIAEQDRMISSENQHFMAERMGAAVRSYDGDHMLLLTAPDVVTDLLLEVARTVEKDLTQA